MFLRTGTLVVMAAASLLAAGEDNKSVLLPGDLAQLSPKQFSETFSKSMSSPDRLQQPLPLLPVQPVLEGQAGKCAVPLTRYKAKDLDPAASVRLLPNIERRDRMGTPPPVPVCEDKVTAVGK